MPHRSELSVQAVDPAEGRTESEDPRPVTVDTLSLGKSAAIFFSIFNARFRWATAISWPRTGGIGASQEDMGQLMWPSRVRFTYSSSVHPPC